MSEAVYSVHAKFVCKQPRSKSDFKKKQQEIFLIRFQADAEKPSGFGNHFLHGLAGAGKTTPTSCLG